MSIKRSKKPIFIAILPAMLLSACPRGEQTKNPPESTTQTHTQNPPGTTPTSTTPPDPRGDNTPPPPHPGPNDKFLPPSYSERKTRGDGTCYVDVYVNPPFQTEVSCTAPIEPGDTSNSWCTVASKADPKVKSMVKCEPKK